MPTPAALDEPAFIAALRALAPDPAARALADDAAVLDFGGETLVLTHDMMVEGVHWLPGQDPADLAFKLVAVNLSDLAAKGAEPIGLLLGYTLAGTEARFLEGLAEALATFAVPLLGGDTVARAPGGVQALGLTALGRATHRPVPDRRGARPGQTLWLTGPLGAAMAGFEMLFANPSDTSPETRAFRRPTPRLAEGRTLAPLVGAMMDVSDGLLLDATRLAEASAVTLAIDSARVPLAQELNDAIDPAATHRALTWGEDYELLFTLPADTLPPCPAFRIGHVLPAGDHPLLLDGTPPQGKIGWQHRPA